MKIIHSQNQNKKPDDFEREVESLRGSATFQSFLEDRAKNGSRIPLSDIEKEIDEELNARP